MALTNPKWSFYLLCPAPERLQPPGSARTRFPTAPHPSGTSWPSLLQIESQGMWGCQREAAGKQGASWAYGYHGVPKTTCKPVCICLHLCSRAEVQEGKINQESSFPEHEPTWGHCYKLLFLTAKPSNQPLACLSLSTAEGSSVTRS